jgi:hypothetical protein
MIRSHRKSCHLGASVQKLSRRVTGQSSISLKATASFGVIDGVFMFGVAYSEGSLNAWINQGKMKPTRECPLLHFLLPKTELLILRHLQTDAARRLACSLGRVAATREFA